MRAGEDATVVVEFAGSPRRGLYFIGPSSAFSFGPMFRFVAGAAYAVPVAARHLAWNRHRERVLAVGSPAAEPA